MVGKEGTFLQSTMYYEETDELLGTILEIGKAGFKHLQEFTLQYSYLNLSKSVHLNKSLVGLCKSLNSMEGVVLTPKWSKRS